MKVISAKVIIDDYRTDLVMLQTDLPSPFPGIIKGFAMLQLDCESGTGAKYVRKNFDIEPQIYDYRNR